MDELKDLLVTSMSKKTAAAIAQEILHDQDSLAELRTIIESHEKPASAKAAWVLRTASDQSPLIMCRRVDWLIKAIKEHPISGARRDLLKCSANLVVNDVIEEDVLGSLIDLCFDRLSDPKAATAERYYSMMMLHHLSTRYPELKSELIESLQLVVEIETRAFRKYATVVINDLTHSQHDS